jgi:hypothetical protein
MSDLTEFPLFRCIDKGLVLKFSDYHRKNPHIYREFLRYAKEMRRFRRKSSGWLIVNRIRWDHDIKSNSRERFKISNDYIALYCRLLISEYPEFEGFFDLKKMKEAGRILSQEERQYQLWNELEFKDD